MMHRRKADRRRDQRKKKTSIARKKEEGQARGRVRLATCDVKHIMFTVKQER